MNKKVLITDIRLNFSGILNFDTFCQRKTHFRDDSNVPSEANATNYWKIPMNTAIHSLNSRGFREILIGVWIII